MELALRGIAIFLLDLVELADGPWRKKIDLAERWDSNSRGVERNQ
jgi:hypothetical protein